MFDPETVAFLESGCGLIVATAGADHEPIASRAWGLSVVAASGTSAEIRVMLGAGDAPTIANVVHGGEIAITGADVRTLHSMQVKGRALGIEPATASDRSRAERFCTEFVAAVEDVDGTSPELLRRIVPTEFVACTVSVGTLYNQTPGPAAGTALREEAQ